MASQVRKALDALLDTFPDTEVTRVETAPDWLIVRLQDTFDQTGLVYTRRAHFAIHRESGEIHRAESMSGPVDEEPLRMLR
jgi:hypothetical protein